MSEEEEDPDDFEPAPPAVQAAFRFLEQAAGQQEQKLALQVAQGERAKFALENERYELENERLADQEFTERQRISAELSKAEIVSRNDQSARDHEARMAETKMASRNHLILLVVWIASVAGLSYPAFILGNRDAVTALLVVFSNGITWFAARGGARTSRESTPEG